MGRHALNPSASSLVGYGLGGSTFHAPLVSATPGLALAGIATSDPARVAQATARYPGVRVVPKPEDLWGSGPAPDLVVISTPHSTDAPIARAALAAGAHVVVDKPFAPRRTRLVSWRRWPRATSASRSPSRTGGSTPTS